MNSHKHVAIFTRRSSALQSPGSCVAQANKLRLILAKQGIDLSDVVVVREGKAQLAARGHG